jgi:hypothetical protein
VTYAERRKLKYWERNLSKHHFVYHKPTRIFPGIELGPLRSEAGDEPKVSGKIYFLPQNKQTSSRSKKLAGLCCMAEIIAASSESLGSAEIYFVGRMYNFVTLSLVVIYKITIRL